MYYVVEDSDGVFITNTLNDRDFVHSEHNSLREAERALARFDQDQKEYFDELLRDDKED